MQTREQRASVQRPRRPFMSLCKLKYCTARQAVQLYIRMSYKKNDFETTYLAEILEK